MEEQNNMLMEDLIKEIEEIKKVLNEKEDIHIFYSQSNDVSEIDKGMIEFHKKIETIDKSGNNAFLKYRYATLDDILAEVNPKLAEEGLYVMQFPINIGKNTLVIRTSLRSSSGQFITMDSVGFPYKPDIQILGSYITYLKRYMLSGILAISFSEDTDCGEEKIPKSAETKKTQTTQTQATESSDAPRRRRSV